MTAPNPDSLREDEANLIAASCAAARARLAADLITELRAEAERFERIAEDEYGGQDSLDVFRHSTALSMRAGLNHAAAIIQRTVQIDGSGSGW